MIFFGVRAQCEECFMEYKIPFGQWFARCDYCDLMVLAPVEEGCKYFEKPCNGVIGYGCADQKGHFTCKECDQQYIVGNKVVDIKCGQNIYNVELFSEYLMKKAEKKKEEEMKEEAEQKEAEKTAKIQAAEKKEEEKQMETKDEKTVECSDYQQKETNKRNFLSQMLMQVSERKEEKTDEEAECQRRQVARARAEAAARREAFARAKTFNRAEAVTKARMNHSKMVEGIRNTVKHVNDLKQDLEFLMNQEFKEKKVEETTEVEEKKAAEKEQTEQQDKAKETDKQLAEDETENIKEEEKEEKEEQKEAVQMKAEVTEKDEEQVAEEKKEEPSAKCHKCKAPVTNDPVNAIWFHGCNFCNEITLDPIEPEFKYVRTICRGQSFFKAEATREIFACTCCLEKHRIDSNASVKVSGQDVYETETYTDIIDRLEKRNKELEEELKGKEAGMDVGGLEEALKKMAVGLNERMNMEVKKVLEGAQKETEEKRALEAKEMAERASMAQTIKNLQEALEKANQKVEKLEGENISFKAAIEEDIVKMNAATQKIEELEDALENENKMSRYLDNEVFFLKGCISKHTEREVIAEADIREYRKKICFLEIKNQEFKEKHVLTDKKIDDLEKSIKHYTDAQSSSNSELEKKDTEIMKMKEQIERMRTSNKILHKMNFQSNEDLEKTRDLNDCLNEFNMMALQKIKEMDQRNVQIEGELKKMLNEKVMALL